MSLFGDENIPFWGSEEQRLKALTAAEAKRAERLPKYEALIIAARAEQLEAIIETPETVIDGESFLEIFQEKEELFYLNVRAKKADVEVGFPPERDKSLQKQLKSDYRRKPEEKHKELDRSKYLPAVIGPSLATATIPPSPNRTYYHLRRPPERREGILKYLQRLAAEDSREPQETDLAQSVAQFANKRYQEAKEAAKTAGAVICACYIATEPGTMDEDLTIEQIKEDFTKASRTKYLLKIEKKGNYEISTYRWAFDSGASGRYCPAAFICIMIKVKRLDQKLTVGNGQTMRIVAEGYIVFPNGQAAKFRAVANLSIVLIGIASTAKEFVGWHFDFSSEGLHVSQRGLCSCKKETVENKIQVATLEANNLYSTSPEKFGALLQHIARTHQQQPWTEGKERGAALMAAETKEPDLSQDRFAANSDVCFFMHLATKTQRSFMHRLFFHRRRMDAAWFGNSIINRPRLPKQQHLCPCMTCALAGKLSMHHDLEAKVTDYVPTRYCEVLYLDYIPDIVKGEEDCRNILLMLEMWAHDSYLQPLQKRAQGLQGFQRIMREKLPMARKVADPLRRPTIKRIDGKDYIQIKYIILDGDPTLTGQSSKLFAKLNKFIAYVAKYHGAIVKINCPNFHFLHGKIERWVKECKTALRVVMFSSPLALKYWTSACTYINRLMYLTPSWSNDGNASPCHKIEARSVDFMREILHKYYPFGTVISFTLADDVVRRKQFSLFGVRGGIAFYLHPGTKRHTIVVLVGTKKFQISPVQVTANYRATHSFSAPIEQITYEKGQKLLLDDPRVKVKLVPTKSGILVKPAVLPQLHRSDIATADNMIVTEQKLKKGEYLTVFNEPTSEFFKIDKNGRIRQRLPGKYLDFNQIDHSSIPKVRKNGLVVTPKVTTATKRQEASKNAPHPPLATAGEAATAASTTAPRQTESSATVVYDDLITELEADIWREPESTWPTLTPSGEDVNEIKSSSTTTSKKRKRNKPMQELFNAKTKQTSEVFRNALRCLGTGFAKRFRRTPTAAPTVFVGMIDQLEDDAKAGTEYPLSVTYPPQLWQDGYSDSENLSLDEVRKGHKLFARHLSERKIDLATLKKLVEVKRQVHRDLLQEARDDHDKQCAALLLQLERSTGRQAVVFAMIKDPKKPTMTDRQRLNEHDLDEEELARAGLNLIQEQDIHKSYAYIVNKDNKSAMNYAPSGVNDIKNCVDGNLRWGTAPPSTGHHLGGACYRESMGFHHVKSFKVIPFDRIPKYTKDGKPTRIYATYFLFKYKPDEIQGKREKGRLVIVGNNSGATKSQRYSPNVSDAYIKTQLALCFYIGLRVTFSFDFSQAFTQCELDPEDYQYLRTSKGLLDENGRPYPKGTYLELRRNHYGLFSASKTLWKKLSAILIDFGFQKGADQCWFTYWDAKADNGKGRLIMLALYVDDALICARTVADVKFCMAVFYSHGLEMEGKLFPTKFTGYNIQYWRNRQDDTEAVTLAADDYRAKLLSKHKDKVDKHSRGRRLPADPQVTDRMFEQAFLDDDTIYEKSSVTEARAFVGEIMYDAGRMGYEIIPPTNRLSRTMTKPSAAFWTACEWLIQYLHQAQKRMPALAYYGAAKTAPLVPMLCSMADSSWRTTVNNRSMLSHLIFLGYGDKWSLLSHSGGLSKTTSLSTGEAETFALCRSTTALVGFSNNLQQEGFQTPNVPSGDNTCSLINSVTGNRRGMPHIPHYLSHLHDSIEAKIIEEPQHVVTGGNFSDLGTKCMRNAKDFEHKRNGVLISRNSAEWTDEWTEFKPSECNIPVTMEEIHQKLSFYGFEVTPAVIAKRSERIRKRKADQAAMKTSTTR